MLKFVTIDDKQPHISAWNAVLVLFKKWLGVFKHYLQQINTNFVPSTITRQETAHFVTNAQLKKT